MDPLTRVLYPTWGGPTGLRPPPLVTSTSPLDGTAMQSLRVICRDFAGPLKSQIVSATVGGIKSSPAFAPDREADYAPLARYEPEVRGYIVLGQLAPLVGLKFDGTKATVTADGGALVTMQSLPKAAYAAELGAVATALPALDAQYAARMSQLLAQDASPIQPFTYLAGISSDTHPRTIEVLEIATNLLGQQIFGLKHVLDVDRPNVQEPDLLPVLRVPSHKSMPGGHAARAHLAVTLLKALSGNAALAGTLATAAYVIGDNRVLAGLHYPSDNDAGELLGQSLAGWLLAVGAVPTGRARYWQGADMVAKGGQYQRSWRDAVSTQVDAPYWRALMAAAAAEWTAPPVS